MYLSMLLPNYVNMVQLGIKSCLKVVLVCCIIIKIDIQCNYSSFLYLFIKIQIIGLYAVVVLYVQRLAFTLMPFMISKSMKIRESSYWNGCCCCGCCCFNALKKQRYEVAPVILCFTTRWQQDFF